MGQREFRADKRTALARNRIPKRLVEVQAHDAIRKGLGVVGDERVLAVNKLHAFGAYCGGDNGEAMRERVHILGEDTGAIADGSGENAASREGGCEVGDFAEPDDLWMVLGEGGIGAVTGDIELDIRSNFVDKGPDFAKQPLECVAVGEVLEITQEQHALTLVKDTARRSCFRDQGEMFSLQIGLKGQEMVPVGFGDIEEQVSARINFHFALLEIVSAL